MAEIMHAARRFWSKVEKGDACWTWKSCVIRPEKPYGQFHYQRRTVLAHRFSWTLHFGPVPAGLFVLHHCDNPRCVNPSHLFLGTDSDNLRDAFAKGRRPRPAGQSLKAHCIQGHAFTNDNTFYRPNGHRRCKICMRIGSTRQTLRRRTDAIERGAHRVKPEEPRA